MQKIILVGILALFSTNTFALEVDPYWAWTVELKDSSDPINHFLNGQLTDTLEKLNQKPSDNISCSDVANKYSKNIHVTIVTSKKLLRYVHNPENGLEQTRGPKQGHFSSVYTSYYRRIPQLYLTSLSYTFDINGIRVGDDKFGHFFGVGRRYYNKYLHLLKDGKSEQEAEDGAIYYGIHKENGILGKVVDGIFSHADLEANFQGFMFHRSLCEGSDPVLKHENRQWVQTRAVDIRPYVTPNLDEGYNINHFAGPYWHLVKSRLVNYCPLLNVPEVQQRLARYKELDRPNRSTVLVAELMARKKIDRAAYSLQNLCTEPR